MFPRAPRFAGMQPGRDLIIIFVLTIALPAVALAVMASRGLLTEQQLAARQLNERVDVASAAVADNLDRELSGWQSMLDRIAGATTVDPTTLPAWFKQATEEPGTATLVVRRDGQSVVWPKASLAYLPFDPAPVVRDPPRGLLDAELVELRDRDLDRAVRLYQAQRLGAGDDDRAWIEHRLARTYFKAGRWRESLGVYQGLARRIDQRIDGLPADLLARVEICEIYEAKSPALLPATAALLYRDLVLGRWQLDKARYLYYVNAARDWNRTAVGQSDPDLATVDERKRALSEALASDADSSEYLVLSSPDPPGGQPPAAVMAVSMAWLRAHRWPEVVARAVDQDLAASVRAPTGDVVFASSAAVLDAAPDAGSSGHRTLKSAAFPWRVDVAPRDPAATSADLVRRRNLYFAVLAGALAILGFGAYATARVVRRELEVARMKSDFVSAVSHEFRSPLTGIRQLAEMLLRGRVPTEARRQEYYELITRESDRLARVVENLLDFARMEEGKRPYRFEPIDTSAWLAEVATAFRAQASSNGHRIVAGIPDALPPVIADREALTTAVDNLLDNAVKYSPDAEAVWLDAEANERTVMIRVRDRGAGINDADRSRVFDRFFRADGELTRQVKGTGLGLSLVAYIVRAHGGQVSVDSQPGAGSTFTIVLPLAPS